MSVEEAVAAYRSNPDVLYAEPNYVYRVFASPNDTLYPLLWGLNNTGQDGGTPDADVDASEAWDITTGSGENVIAVIDTGIDYTHPDLAANLYRNEIECTLNGVDDDGNGYVDDCYGIAASGFPSDPMDDIGHGTHVAGTIGAVGNNGIGVAGVNWSVKLLPCKLFGLEFGVGDVLRCMDYIRDLKDRGVNILATSNSWGGSFFSQALLDAIESHRQRGILFVAAAGNEFGNNDENPIYPASYNVPNIISVAATDGHDEKPVFSNVGPRTVHLGAPGVEVVSTVPNAGYAAFSGTSMSTPHVSGAAALLKSQDPNRDWKAIKNLILAGGDNVSSMSETITGKRLNLYGSMTCAGSTLQKRLRPVRDTVAASVGGSVDLEVLNINCALPNGELDVSVAPTGETFRLFDDGAEPDKAAGDGIYSGRWLAPAFGSYTLVLPNGENVSVQVLENYQYEKTDFTYRSFPGANLDLGDDDVAEITSPFPIPFGSGSFPLLYISSNGTVSFTEAYSEFANLGLPVFDGRAITLVAPFWDDLYPVRGTEQNVFWDVLDTAPNRELVVEWRNVRAYRCASDETTTASFQVVFFEDSSEVLFNYADTVFDGECNWMNRGASATIGIQVSPSAARLLHVSQGTPQSIQEGEIVDNGDAYLWTLEASSPVPNPVPQLSSISPDSATLQSPDFELTVRGENFIPTSVVVFGFGGARVTTFVSDTELRALIPAEDLAWLTWDIDVRVFNPEPGGGLSNPLTFHIVPPVPAITSLSPPSAAAGGMSFRLTIYGSGFFGGSQVRWNGLFRDFAVYYSPNQLVVPVYSSDIASPGTAQVEVVNGGVASNSVTFTIGPPGTTPSDPGAAARITKDSPPPPGAPYRFLGWKYAATAGPDYLKRFTRSPGHPAIPLINPEAGKAGSSAAGLRALAAGTELPGFLLREALPAGYLPTDVATGDFNRDGFPDWVVCNGGDNTLWLYFGRGNGEAEIPQILALAGSVPLWIETADLRGNGILDLVVAEPDSASVGVLLGNGDGTFASELTYYLPMPPFTLQVADFNGDGHRDVLAGVPGGVNYGPLILLPGDGTGGLGPPVYRGGEDYFRGVFTIWMASSDLDLDGDMDIVLVDFLLSIASEPGVLSYLNNGDGTFKKTQYVYDGYFDPALSVAAADLNEDGCSDVVFTASLDLNYFYPGNCNGTFRRRPSPDARLSSPGNSGVVVALGNVNNDSHLDIVTSGVVLGGPSIYGQEAGHLLSVQLGDGAGNFQRARLYRGEPSAIGLALVDLNQDGFLDVVTANQDSDSSSVYLNDGQGRFGAPEGFYVGYLAEGGFEGVLNSPRDPVQAADVDHDGDLDLAMIEFGYLYPQPYQLTFVLNDGTGRFTGPIRSPALEATLHWGRFVLAEFRGTGELDFVGMDMAPSAGDSAVFFARGLGNGSFEPATKVSSLPGQQELVATGDFNRDGNLDFVMAGLASSPRITAFLGNGSGGFAPQPAISFGQGLTSHYPRQLFVADFNGDNNPDILVWIQDNLMGGANDSVVQFLGRGDGTFGPATIMFPQFNPFTLADLNADGHLDIIGSETIINDFSKPILPEVSIYLGQADGTFSAPTTYRPYAGGSLSAMTTQGYLPFYPADFNGDGKLDIMVFQLTLGFPRRAYVQFMMGNGDGTFTPTYNTYEFHKIGVPQSAADVTGDGRADPIELNGYNASFHVLPAQPAASHQLRLLRGRVVGTIGLARVSLNVPLPVDTTVALSASDPAIQVPPSLVIPANQVAQDFEFTIDSSFDPASAFEIRAELDGQTAAATGMQVIPGMPTGFVAFLYIGNATFLPGQTIVGEIGVQSLGGYATSGIQLSCSSDSPLEISCNFPDPIPDLRAGEGFVTRVRIAIGASTPVGTYPFQIHVTDGAAAYTLRSRLRIGDFRLSVGPATKVALPTGSGEVPVSTTVVNGGFFSATIAITCSDLPAGATCRPTEAAYNAPVPLVIDTVGVPVGNYAFTVTGAAGSISHSAPAELILGDFAVELTGPSGPAYSTGSADYQLSLTSVNGYQGLASTTCLGLPSGAVCALQSSPIPATRTLTINTINVTPGTYTFTLVVTSGATAHSVTAELEVIPPFITVTTPNGGDQFIAGTVQTITWTFGGNPGPSVSIQLINMDTGKRTLLASSAPAGSAGNGSFIWSIPVTQKPGSFRIAVASNSSPSLKDESDSSFAILKQTITVTFPTSGAVVPRGTAQTITWVFTGGLGPTVQILLYKGKILDSTIADLVSAGSNGNGSFEWNVPAGLTPGAGYKIRIISNANSKVKGKGGKFTIQ